MTTAEQPQRPEIEYRGIIIRTYDIPCTPYVWSHDELDGGGHAATIEEAREQIDRHLKLVESMNDEEWKGGPTDA